MRMAEFHIDGFGRFADLSFENIPPGLTVVLGDNEAGKSTLLAFLRSVLFGLPSRRQKEFYPPLRGGRKGGRVVLYDGSEGRVIVERFAGKGTGQFTVTFPDGSQGGEEKFHRLIGSATADLYNNIFAFSLSELQTFDSLKTEKVRDAIYSAGTGFGRRTITDITRELKKQSGELFAPQASKPVINALLSRIETIDQQIKAHEKDQDEYERIYAALQSCELSIQDISAELKTSRQRLERVRLLLGAREDWIALCDSRNQLLMLPAVERFPEEGVSRLDVLNAEKRSIEDRMQDIGSQKETAEKELVALQEEPILLSSADDIHRLDRSLQLFEKNRQNCVDTQKSLSLAEKQLVDMLYNIGDEWDEENLRVFDMSVPVREEIQAHIRMVDAAKAAVHDRELELSQQKRLLQDAQTNEHRAQTGLEQLPRPFENMDTDAIGRLKLGRETYENARRDLPGIEKQCETRREHLSDTLRNVGLDWTEQRLKAFDTSLAVQEQVSEYQRRISECRSEVKDADRRLRDAQQAVADAEADLARMEKALAEIPEPGAKDSKELARRKDSLRRLRSLLNTRRQHLFMHSFSEEKKHDLEARAARLKARPAHATASVPAWSAALVLALGLAGFLAAGIRHGDWVFACLILGLSAIIAVLPALLLKASAARTKKRAAESEKEIKELENSIYKLQQEIDALHSRRAETDAQIQKEARALGFDHACDEKSIDDAEELTEQEQQNLQRFRIAEQRRDDAAEHLKAAQERRQRSEAEKAHAEQQLDAVTRQWRGWLSVAGLPDTLTPESAKTTLSTLETAREQLKSIESDCMRISRMAETIAAYEEKALCAAKQCDIGKAAPDDPAALLDALFSRLEQHERITRDREHAEKILAEAGKHTEQAKRRVGDAEQHYLHAQAELQDCMRRWKALLQRTGLRTTLSAESAPQMLQAVEKARGQLAEVDRHRRQLQILQEFIDSFCSEVRSIAQAAGWEKPANDDVSKCVSALHARLEKAEKVRSRADELKRRMKDCNDQIRPLQSQIEKRRKEISDLFEAASVTDEEAFRLRASDYERRKELESAVHTLETRLRQLTGSGDALEHLERELESTTSEDLTCELKELEEAIDQREQEQRYAIDNGGQLRSQLEQLENSQELSRLLIEGRSCRAGVESAAEQWAVLKIAEHLIDRAREKYERERRPAVLKEAERYFTSFTRGSYTEIRAPAGRDQIVVIAPDGSTREIDQLSRGTAEQLYLSLRFGFAKEFVSRSEALPLVFDDILVNFDPHRARAAAETIVELSRSLQILLFTCHPPTVELMRNVDRTVPACALSDGRFEEI